RRRETGQHGEGLEGGVAAQAQSPSVECFEGGLVKLVVADDESDCGAGVDEEIRITTSARHGGGHGHRRRGWWPRPRPRRVSPVGRLSWPDLRRRWPPPGERCR